MCFSPRDLPTLVIPFVVSIYWKQDSGGIICLLSVESNSSPVSPSSSPFPGIIGRLKMVDYHALMLELHGVNLALSEVSLADGRRN